MIRCGRLIRRFASPPRHSLLPDPMQQVRLKYGKQSQLFTSGIDAPDWQCFTLYVTHEGTSKELDFVCEDLRVLTNIVTTLDLFCGDNSGRPLSRARFLWQAAMYRTIASQSKLATMVMAGVHEDEDDKE